MFLCFGSQKKRLHMSMQALYSPEEMFEKAQPHMVGSVCHLINHQGTTTSVKIVPGVTLEFGPGLFTPIDNEGELKIASRMVVLYHDSLRSESELVDIEEHERSLYETSLLEEAMTNQLQETYFGSDTDTLAD
jgi:hypothetical protein